MKVEISNGELVDKVSILAVKLKQMKSTEKKSNVMREFNLLLVSMKAIGITEDSEVFLELIAVNTALWNIEDEIRSKEAAGVFDEEFVRLARSVYYENDRRASIKKSINERTQSALTEEKEYVSYDNQIS